jgi:hypothetical protein
MKLGFFFVNCEFDSLYEYLLASCTMLTHNAQDCYEGQQVFSNLSSSDLTFVVPQKSFHFSDLTSLFVENET